MKKLLIYGMVLIILLSCAGCNGGGQKIADFQSNEISNIEIYNLPVPSASKRKIVTGAKDIKTIINTLSAVRIKGEGSAAESTAGGAIQFVFSKSDNSQFAISYNGSTIQSQENFWYEVDNGDRIFDLWDEMNYTEQDVQEYELPFFPKNKVPYLQLRYMTREDYYNLNALLGTYSWSFENEDGITTAIESDSAHPLDSVGQMPEIEKTDDMRIIELKFLIPPTSYTVRRWENKYIGDAQAYEQYYETADVSDNAIVLSDDGKEYVYEVYATWPQGNAHYSFYVTSE
jgi:hypothetical protein